MLAHKYIIAVFGIHKDLIMCYVALDLTDFFVLSKNTCAMGHNFKLLKNNFIQMYFFSNHIIDMRNNAPS